MKTHRFASLAAIAAMAWLLGSSAVVRADDWKVDPVHSSLAFWAHHMSAGYTMGSFIVTDDSKITTDASDPAKTTFDITASTDSLDTRNEQRNKDLKGPDWFDAKQFTTLSFKSTSVKSGGDNALEVTGDLTIHGVTKSITVTIKNTGTGKGMKGETHVGYMAEFTVNRADFGINAKAPESMVGNDVRIMVALEAVAQ
jgi:polyisoprenoid-binding protein YceI